MFVKKRSPFLDIMFISQVVALFLKTKDFKTFSYIFQPWPNVPEAYTKQWHGEIIERREGMGAGEKQQLNLKVCSQILWFVI